MSSREQELPTTKNDDDKDSSSQPTETTVVSKAPNDTPKESGDEIKLKVDDSNTVTDVAPEDCGDTSKQPIDNPSKPVDLNKSSEFDDEDDFNSDELQLRWDEDDEQINDEKSDDNEEDDLFTKTSESGNPSTSLVTAVKELENALIETSSNNLNVRSPNKNKNDTIGEKEAEGNSSKEILDDIDKLIGNDDVEKMDTSKCIANDHTDCKNVSTVVAKGTEDAHKDESTSNNKMDVDLVAGSEKPTDTINLDESTECLYTVNESSLFSSTVNDSVFDDDRKVEHGLKKPDVMLEIPTQELIDCMDDFDSDNEKSDETYKSVDVSNQISFLEKDIDSKISDNTIDQEMTESSSGLTRKDVIDNENATKEVDSRKDDIDSKIQDREVINQQNVENILKLTENYEGDNAAQKLDSKSERNAENTSELNTEDQAPTSVNDVEMCDVSDKNEAVLQNTIDKAIEKDNVENTEKRTENVEGVNVAQKLDSKSERNAENTSELNTKDQTPTSVNDVEMCDVSDKNKAVLQNTIDTAIEKDNVENTEKRTENDEGGNVAHKLDSKSERNAENTSELNTDQAPTSVDDVEMCDDSDKNEAVLQNTIDKAIEKDYVDNTEKHTEISPTDQNTLDTSDDSAMEVDQTKTPEKELKSILTSEELPKEAQNKEKSVDVLQTNEIVDKTTKQIKKVTTSHENEEIKPVATSPKDKGADITAAIGNTDTNAATTMKSSFDECKDNLKEFKQKSDTQEKTIDIKPTESKETSTKQVSDSKAIVAPGIELDSTISDQKCVKKEESNVFVNVQTVAPKLDQLSPSEERNVKVEATTQDQLSKLVSAKALKNVETGTPTMDKPSVPKDSSNEDQITPSLDKTSSEVASKDPVLDQTSTLAETKSNEETIATTLDPTTERRSRDPVLDEPSTSAEPASKDPVVDKPSTLAETKSNEEPIAPTLDPITEQGPKDPVLDEPSTSAEPASKDPVVDQTSTLAETKSNEEPIAPTLDLISEQGSKDPVLDEPSTSAKPESNDLVVDQTSTLAETKSNEEPIAPTLDPITEQGSKDPVLDEPSTSAEPASKDPVVDHTSTLAKTKSNEEPIATTLDPITEQGSKDPVLDEPSTSTEKSKDPSKVEVTAPILDPVSSEPKATAPILDPVISEPKTTAPILDPVISEPIATAPILDPVSSEPKAKAPILDPVSSESKTAVPILDPVSSEPKATAPILDPVSSEPKASAPILDPVSSEPNPTAPILDPVSSEPKATAPILDPVSTNDKVDQPSAKEKELDQIPDTTDEVPEMEDTLGLLAESSRMVDADAEEGSSEGGEAEEDDDGDDDDFDPDDESSNQMTGEHSEESNAQADKEDGQIDKGDKTPKTEKEFNFAIASVNKEAEDGVEMEVTEESKALDDVVASTEDIPLATDAEITYEAVTVTQAQDEQPKEPESIKESQISDKETVTAANSILKELLSKQAAVLRTSEGVVDIESSSEDDEVKKKKIGVGATSTDKEKKTAPSTSQKKKSTLEEAAQTPKEDKNLPVVVKVTSEPTKAKTATNSEVFNLSSDDDDVPAIANDIVIEEKRESNKCINPSCRSGARTSYVIADAAARAYFDADTKKKKKKHRVCLACAESVVERTKGLVNGVKEFTPLLELDLRKVSSETVEISDSDSDDGETEPAQTDILGESGAKFLEEHLADVINETWLKYKLDERLGHAQTELNEELAKLEAESKEIDTMLNECQVATDLLRNQLYATFEPERRELTGICIMDTPLEKYSFCEIVDSQPASDTRMKRKSTTPSDQVAKRAVLPLGYTPLGAEDAKVPSEASNIDDDKDVSVVKLSAESAPSDLPPPGEIVRQPLRAGMSVFAMRNSFCSWVPGKILDVQPKNPANPFTMCRVRFEIRQKVATRVLAARCLAYLQPADVRLTIGTRVIAISQENAKSDDTQKKTFYSGIVAEIPNPVNSYRYLIFFDHGYAQYVHHRDTRVVCESASLVWEEVHPNSREFVKQYLLAYPERPMVRLHAGQSLKTEWNGKWWVTKVLQVDASLVEVSFEDNRTEWIYRGSTRLAPLFLELQAAERQRARPLPRSNQRRMNMPYVEYTRSEEQNKAEAVAAADKARQEQHNEEMRRQRAVAKKSTALPTPTPSQPTPSNLDSVTSRVVYYTPKNAVKPLKMTPHTCSPKCKRSDVLALKDLRTYNPLAKPLLSGWERQIVRFKGHKEVMYRAPCGRRLRNMRELHRYLRAIQSDMGVDLFDFNANTHCLAEFVLNKCLVGKKDLSHGKENVPVPCVNYYDESLPEFCSYNTERTPTAGVPLNLDPDFLCGCDCTDDCEDKSKCACWKMTLEGARTIGLRGCDVGYEYKRLPEPLPSGIYECNARCKCKQTCLNRVAQHPLQLKLQVFKTMNRGWGIRALNDVPKGSFLCVYAGNLLTDATANLDGLNEGDEYLAELDYIEVVEQMKEGFEADIPDADKRLDRQSSKSTSEEEEPSSDDEDNSNDKEDGDFQPNLHKYIGLGLTEFNKRLRKRDRTRKKDANKEKSKEIDKGMEDDGCITISDDEEAKEPTQFTAQTGIGANQFVRKYKSVRTLFGKDEACYIMDAKVQGNIGRYLNHSCTPNVFVQNVFVDTHDPRFPWVAFFALSHIRAGTELTWNYNYDVGSVPGKTLYCYCGAPNCRGRLL